MWVDMACQARTRAGRAKVDAVHHAAPLPGDPVAAGHAHRRAVVQSLALRAARVPAHDADRQRARQRRLHLHPRAARALHRRRQRGRVGHAIPARPLRC